MFIFLSLDFNMKQGDKAFKSNRLLVKIRCHLFCFSFNTLAISKSNPNVYTKGSELFFNNGLSIFSLVLIFI